MDPISMITAASTVIGVGMSLFGGNQASKIAGEIAGDEQAIEGLNRDINGQRRQQMLLDAQRQQLQDVRNSQKARSMALTASVSQGAQFGSGLAGGYGQISGETQTNLLGISQNKALAENIFSDTDKQDVLKSQIASLQGEEASAKGTMAIGQGITSGAGTIGKLFGGGLSSLGSLFGSGSTAGGMGLGGGSNMFTSTGGFF